MENSLKQRIIGAVVLVALAIIFLPVILKEKSSNGVFISKIPEKPKELEEYVIDTQKIDRLIGEKSQLDVNEQKKRSSQNAVNSNSSVESKTNQTKQDNNTRKTKSTVSASNKSESKLASQPNIKQSTQSVSNDKLNAKKTESKTISNQYIDAAWVVQVASFSMQANAVAMVNKLKKSNFKAYRRRVTADKKAVYRVFVGPYIERKEAEKSISSINKISEGKVIIKPFDPVKH